MQRAMKLVKDGVSARRASELCGVPRSTLSDKLSGRFPLRPSRSNFVLTNEEEAKLVGHILQMRRGGCPMGKREIQKEVKKILDKDKRKNPFKDNLPGKDWYYSFCKRHPKIKEVPKKKPVKYIIQYE